MNLRPAVALLGFIIPLAGLADDPKSPEVLVNVAVAARDLPAGAQLSESDVVVLALPKSLATDSVVGIEDARKYAVNAKLLVPMLKGDWIQWSALSLRVPQILPLCLEAAKSGGDPRAEIARARALLKGAAKK